MKRLTRFLEDDGVTEAIVAEFPIAWRGFSDFYSGLRGFWATVVPDYLVGVVNGSTEESIGLQSSTAGSIGPPRAYRSSAASCTRRMRACDRSAASR